MGWAVLRAKDTATDTRGISWALTENVYLVKMRYSSNITCGSTKLVLPLIERYVFSFSFNNFWIFSQKMMNLLNSETVFRFMNIFMLFFKSWAIFSNFRVHFSFETLICFPKILVYFQFMNIFRINLLKMKNNENKQNRTRARQLTPHVVVSSAI